MGHGITGNWGVRSSVRLPLYYDAWRGLRYFTKHIFNIKKRSEKARHFMEIN